VWRSAVKGGVPALGAAVGDVAVVLGVAGGYASGRICLVPARPVWNSKRTLGAFFATALSIGPLVTLFCIERAQLDGGWIGVLLGASAAGTMVQLAVLAHLVRTVRRRHDRQHRGTATLLLDRFRGLFAARIALAVTGLALSAWALAVPVAGPAAAGRFGTSLVVLVLGEIIGRYLFYVTVVPYGMAANFFEKP